MFTMTYVRSRGQQPRTVELNLNDRAVERFCKTFANSAHRVVLTEIDDDGLPTVVARYENGRAKRDLPTVRAPRPRVIEGEVADESAVGISLDEQTDDGTDEMQYEGFCVKCHEHRTFEGEIVITANGRRMAQGPCPVCGTKMNRILKNVPVEEQDTFETPDDDAELDETDSAEPVGVLHILQKDDAGRGKVRLFCSCDEWETTVKRGSANEVAATAAFSEHAADDEEYDDHPDTDETAPEILPTDDPDYDEAAQQEAEAAAIEVGEGQQEITDEDAGAAAAEEMENEVSAPQFSDATAKPAQATKPRKRAAKKAAEPKGDGLNVEGREKRFAECPHCMNNIEVKTVPAAKMAYLVVHADRTHNKPECLGSRASVPFEE